MKKFIILLAAATILYGCPPKEPVIKSIRLSKTSTTIDLGGTDQLVANVDPSTITPNLKWESSDPNIVTVTQNGTVKGIAKGVATVTASQAGVTSPACTVTVVDPLENVIFAEWGIMDYPSDIGPDPDNATRTLAIMPIILLSDKIFVDDDGYFIWGDGDNYYIYTYIVMTYDDQYWYILGSWDADVDFWTRPDEEYHKHTFIPGIEDNDDIYGSFLYKVHTEDGEVIDADSYVAGTLDAGTFEIRVVNNADVIPSYNLTATIFDMDNAQYTFTKVAANIPAKIKGLEGTRIKKSDIKVFKEGNGLKKVSMKLK